MATTNDFRRGMVIDIGGVLSQVVEFQHVNPGKGAAFVRSRLKEVLSGKVIDKTWRAGEKVTEVRVEHRVELLSSESSLLIPVSREIQPAEGQNRRLCRPVL